MDGDAKPTNLSRGGGRRGKLAAAALAAAVTVALVPTAADAHYFGGRYPKAANSYLYIPWTQAGSYATPVANAMSAWYNTPTVVWPYKTTNYSTSRADFYGYSNSATWWGYSVNHPCYQAGCSYTWADEYMNTSTIPANDGFIQQKVAVHEFGHGIGLAHPDNVVTSVMNQGYLSYNTPQAHDNNDTNALYPY